MKQYTDMMSDTTGQRIAEQLEKLKVPTNTIIEKEVDNWLSEHPEVTTSVQNGSITEPKIEKEFLEEIKNSNVTVDTLGAVSKEKHTEDINTVDKNINTAKSQVQSEVKAEETSRKNSDSLLDAKLASVKNTSESSDAALSKRIDNLVLNAGGDSSVEVTDARTGVDGTAYDTLKGRLDGEIGTLQGLGLKVQDGKLCIVYESGETL